jgi:sugar/nucleoside kinase (ribokinase family)
LSVLVSVGNAVIDVTARVPALPERGGDVLATSSGLRVGGAGFNVLVAAARQGLAGRYAGAHGTGPLGELVRAALQREGIGVLLPPVPGADTGFDVALTDAGGERTFITAVGAEAQLSADRLAAVAVSPDDLVHVAGYALVHEGSREAIAGWLATLPAETLVLFDPGPLAGDIPPGILAAVMRRATWWSGTLAEAAAATGMTEGGADPVTAAQTLARRLAAGAVTSLATRSATRSDTGSAMGVIVRLGAAGCVILAPGAEPVHVPGIAVEVVDSNGAGDAHVGAFLAALAAGAHPLEAARRAGACAALTVTRPGPATSPSRADVDALLASGR